MKYDEIYSKFLSTERLRKTNEAGRTPQEEAYSDRGRIVTSKAFRRLQTKAQVFSLEDNAAIRSRLTHTLEVSIHGQWIANQAMNFMSRDRKLSDKFRSRMVSTVENACLLHDIGNPPFGHLGEYAIQEWFRRTENEMDIKTGWGMLSGDEKRDYYCAFKYFDGNPQGLRMVMTSHWLYDSFGLNLTTGLLGSFVKYLSYFPTKESSVLFRKKAGFFYTDIDKIKKVWNKVGLSTNDDGLPAQRHPLVFIMEAADDIAYCLSDIEDALEKNIISERKFFSELPPALREFRPKRPANYKKFDTCNNINFKRFKTRIIKYLTRAAAECFSENQDSIVNGDFRGGLLDYDELATLAVVHLKRFTRENVFSSKEAVDIELSGYNIIQSLLNHFKPVMIAGSHDFASLRPDNTSGVSGSGNLTLERRLVALLPRRHFACYKFHVDSDTSGKYEPVHRAHMIVDFISGMTDSHALKVFKMLNGIEIGVIP